MAVIHDIEIGEIGIVGGVNLEVPYIAGRFSGDLLVMGCGGTLWDDYAKIHDRYKGHKMAVNRVIIDFPSPLDHAASCEPYHLVLLTLLRRDSYPLHPHVYTHSCDISDWGNYEEHLIPQFVWFFPEYRDGSSTLHAVLAALIMGYDNIILAGVPMNSGGHYYNPFWVHDYDKAFMGDWEKAARKCFHGKVTSLSGNTRELLGAPKGY